MSPATLVSIVMPVWKPHPDWFPAALASVLGQAGCRLELIIVDDGNDPPIELASEHPESVRIVHVPHGGVSAARTAGVKAARGDWIRYVDCDDLLPPDSTRRLLDAARARPDAALVFGDTLRCDEDLTPRGVDRCRLKQVSAPDCLLGRFRAWLPAMLFPRRTVDAVGAWDERLEVSSDWDYVLRALEHGPGYRTPAQVYIYRQHRGSVSGGNVPGRGSWAARRIVEGYFERHPERRRSRIQRRALRRVEAHEFRDSLAGRTWWRSHKFWLGLLSTPRRAVHALPALVRSSVPNRLRSALFALLHFRRAGR